MQKWKKKYPGAIQSWIDNWEVLSVFFKFSEEIRKIMYTTNAIESLKEFRVPITPKTLYIEMEALMYEYTGRQILQEAKKL